MTDNEKPKRRENSNLATRLQYPVFVIASRDGVVVVTPGGKECVLIFHDQDLAEEQIQAIQVSHPQLGGLHALPIPDAQSLREALNSLPSDVTCAVWDPTGTPAGFSHVCLDELL
jgi:hypothetical protein